MYFLVYVPNRLCGVTIVYRSSLRVADKHTSLAALDPSSQGRDAAKSLVAAELSPVKPRWRHSLSTAEPDLHGTTPLPVLATGPSRIRSTLIPSNSYLPWRTTEDDQRQHVNGFLRFARGPSTVHRAPASSMHHAPWNQQQATSPFHARNSKCERCTTFGFWFQNFQRGALSWKLLPSLTTVFLVAPTNDDGSHPFFPLLRPATPSLFQSLPRRRADGRGNS